MKPIWLDGAPPGVCVCVCVHEVRCCSAYVTYLLNYSAVYVSYVTIVVISPQIRIFS